MQFAPDAYAEGISNHAAGSEIEVLVDTIDRTIDALDNAGDYWAGMISGLPKYSKEEQEYAEEVEHINLLQAKWRELRRELVEHPENAELSFGDNDDEEE